MSLSATIRKDSFAMEHIRVSFPESNPQPSADSIPDGFDPAATPILAIHWFGIEPFRQVGEVAAEIVAGLSFRRRVTRLHERGPRVVAEFLAELGAERLMTTVIDQMLHRFLTVPDEALEATGARDFPPVPIHGVRR